MQKNENRPGYKKTKIGWIPEEWGCVPLGEVFSERRTRGEPGLHVFSVTQDRGLVRRDRVDRRVASTLTSEECLLVEPGDFAYNMMRMWQGAVDLCTERGVVSPAYVVCRPRITSVFPPFMFRYFKSPWGLYKLWSYSYGLTNDRLRLYFKDFCHVPAPLPPLPEQEAIAGVLQCWGKAIRGYEKKIEKKRNIKKGLMQRLLSGKQRLTGSWEEWKKASLKDLLSYERPDKHLVHSTEYSQLNGIPVLTANKSFILGYTSESFGVCTNTPVIVFDDFTTSSQYVDFPFKVKSSAIKLLRPAHGRVNPRFVFERMQLLKFSVGEHKRHYISEYQHLRLAVPGFPEQCAISSVLTKADAEIAALKCKLRVFKAQRRFMVNNLVTGAIRLPQFVGAAQTADTKGDTE